MGVAQIKIQHFIRQVRFVEAGKKIKWKNTEEIKKRLEFPSSPGSIENLQLTVYVT